MNKVIPKVWGFYFYGLRIFFSLLFYPFMYFNLLKPNRWCTAHNWRRIATRVFFKTVFVEIEKEELQHIDWTRNYVICANHTSSLDIFAMNAMIPGCVSYLGKAELANIPLMGIFFRTIDVPVERSNAGAAARSFIKAGETLRQGRHLVIFPEGGIFGDTRKLKPFKDGAFRLAIREKTAILPVIFQNAWQLVPDGNLEARPGKLRVIFAAPIETVHMQAENEGELKKRVYREIAQHLNTEQ